MFFKKLELFGFKSFADKTDFSFDSGITVVVGPNGCGKSNIVDAICWVLGEQSAKLLRGKEMQDVIYNGPYEDKHTGFAEVTLYFDNTNHRLPLDFNEVSISRRLFRTGESAYLINQQPVRLKDVRDLLLDTGVGVSSYSVVGQGRVDVLLNANPLERREIFEEAAGVSRYKHRKKEAGRRLERTEQNLTHFRTIIEEVSKNLRSVRIQAGRARKFREYREKYRELKLQLSLHQFHELTGRLSAERAKRVAGEAAVDEKRAEEGRLAAAVSETSERLQQVTAVLQEEAERLAEINAHLLHRQGRQQELEQRTREYEENREKQEKQREEAAGAIAAYAREQAALAETGARFARELAAGEASIRGKERQQEEHRRRHLEMEQELHDLEERLFTLNQERSQRTNRQVECRAELRNVEPRLARHRQEEASLASSLAESEERLRDRQAGETRLSGEASAFEAEHRSLHDRLARENERGQALSARIQELSRYLLQKKTRRHLLASLLAEGEGSSADHQRFRKLCREQSLAGVQGLLASAVDAPPELAPALEAVLKDESQYFLVPDLSQALALAAQVRHPGAARITLAVLPKAPAVPAAAIALASPGLLGRLIDRLQMAPAVRGLLEKLVGDIWLVKDFEEACRLAPERISGRLVTLAGEVLDPRGLVSVGQETGEQSLWKIRAEEKILEQELAEGDTALEYTQHRAGSLQIFCQHLNRRLQELRTREYELRVALQEEQGQLRRETEKREETARALHTVTREIALDLQEEKRIRTALEEETRQLARREEEILAQEAARREKETARHACGEEVRTLEQALQEERIRQAGLQEKRQAAADQARRLETLLQSTRQECARRETERDESARQAARCREAREKNREEEKLLAAERDRREASRVEQEKARGELLPAVVARQAELKACATERERLSEGLTRFTLREKEIELKLAHLVELTAGDLECSLAEAYSSYQDQELPWDRMTAEAEELKEKMARSGNVNLDAISEEDVLARRLEELTAQEQDLARAKADLESVIKDLSLKSEELFRTTFAATRENFQEIFRKLFGGGKADLVLPEGPDMLEAGIEIIARPPGKEPRTLSLLSGGEKTMTVIALLFALFRTKPSPFCLLDEVDAALDESNIDRFLALLREYTCDTQFILVSHNKRTMSIADIMYGVTMQRAGISRKISVRFEDKELRVA